MVNAEKIFSPDFLTELSGAVDRYYDSGDDGPGGGGFREGYEHFHNAAGQATIVKAAALSLGLKSVTYGTYELPIGTTHPEGEGAGYDWEVVADRWLVDLWLMSYYSKGPVVYDLSDPKQLARAETTFGHMEDWEKHSGDDPNEIALATKIFKEFVAPYDAVDHLLSGEG